MICLWGQALALYYLGVSFVTLVTELDPDCFELLKKVHHAINDPITFWNYDHDMAKGRHVADVDLYLGASPGQDFSNAGQGRGLHWPLSKVLFGSMLQCKRQTVARADREDPAVWFEFQVCFQGFHVGECERPLPSAPVCSR